MPLDLLSESVSQRPRIRVAGLTDAVLTTRGVRLCFELYGAAPADCPVWPSRIHTNADRFEALNSSCAAWAARCLIAENAALVPLHRAEGGLTTGGDDAKCLRLSYPDDDIHANPRGSWTLAELLDLKDAFRETMNARLAGLYGAETETFTPPQTRATLFIE